MRKVLLAAMCAASVVAAGDASAAKFQDATAKAVPVAGTDGLAALFWASTVDCGKSAQDDLLRRQCEGVRQSRAEATAGQTFVLDVADPSAVQLGPWDDAKKVLPVSVRGCLACATQIDAGGEKRYVTTKGATSVSGGALAGPEIARTSRAFKYKNQAERWSQVAGKRLKTQLVFKVNAANAAWVSGGNKGFAVDLVGYRVYDPCDGKIVAAEPASDDEPADKASCVGGSASVNEPEVIVEQKKKEPELPFTLSTTQIKNELSSNAQPAVQACFATYGVPGQADLMIEIEGASGKVKEVELTGDFEETPTGDCIIKAVKDVQFPKFKKESMTFPYPFILR